MKSKFNAKVNFGEQSLGQLYNGTISVIYLKKFKVWQAGFFSVALVQKECVTEVLRVALFCLW